MANKYDNSPCENNCGHPGREHYCNYTDINTTREGYECAHCSCVVYPQQMSDPNNTYVEGVGWVRNEDLHKYGSSGRKRFLGIF